MTRINPAFSVIACPDWLLHCNRGPPQIGLDICSALKDLHALGVVHRDIKPSNVVRTEVRAAPPRSSASRNWHGRKSSRRLVSVSQVESARAAFDEMDSDHDGSVGPAEFLRSRFGKWLGAVGATEAFGALDRDGRGRVSLAEWTAGYSTLQARLAAGGTSASVNMNTSGSVSSTSLASSLRSALGMLGTTSVNISQEVRARNGGAIVASKNANGWHQEPAGPLTGSSQEDGGPLSSELMFPSSPDANLPSKAPVITELPEASSAAGGSAAGGGRGSGTGLVTSGQKKYIYQVLAEPLTITLLNLWSSGRVYTRAICYVEVLLRRTTSLRRASQALLSWLLTSDLLKN